MIFPAELNQSAISRLLFPQQGEFSGEKTTILKTGGGSFQGKFSFIKEDANAPGIILFPATDVQLRQLDEFIDGFARQQLNTLLLSSPPWSAENNGQVMLQEYVDKGPELFDAAEALIREQGVQGPLFVAGHGLGALPAMKAIQARPEKLKGLLLEGVICDLQKFLLAAGNTTETPAIDNTLFSNELERAIEQISKPTLLFHGAADDISSIAQAERLQSFSGARTKQFFVIPGAKNPGEAPLCHWAGELYFSTIRTFINTTCSINTWRQRRQKARIPRK